MLRAYAAVLLSLLLSTVRAGGTVTVTGASSTVTCTRFRETGFWQIDIDNYPALPALCGPPLAYNAIRDKSKLPLQIVGVVGAYVFFLFSVASLLLTVGRRMRKQAENATGQLKELEVVNASKYGLSSPAPSHKSWMKGFRSLKGMSSISSKASNPASPISPGLESMTSFDNRVLQTDRESRQAEMDRLYAAVQAHEDAKKSQSYISKAESHESLRSGSDIRAGSDVISVSPPKESIRKNLRVQISEVPAEIPRGSLRESAPKSPYKAIYPSYPSHPSPGMGGFQVSAYTPITPRTPFSPARVDLPNDMYPASPPPKNVRMQMPPPRSSGNDSSSSNKSRKLGIKNLKISGPQPFSGEDDEEDRMPLSPIPHNPPAPPAPPAYNDTYANERLDQPRPLPSSQLSRPVPPPITLPTSPKPPARSPAPANALPLRAYASQETISTNPISPGIKQTILERKVDKVGRGPMTGRTPRTGVPMTPYTPYMPYTPITPVTPGLVSRKDRKERIKAQGRQVLAEEDEVKNEDDMWDGGY